MAAAIDAEALFMEVNEIQKELQKLNVKKAFDANEIYELLESNSFRADRVQFVIAHLLFTLGGRENVYGDVINVSDESSDGYAGDYLTYTSSPEYEISDSIALNLTMPELKPEVNTYGHKNADVQINGNSNSSVDTVKTGIHHPIGDNEIDEAVASISVNDEKTDESAVTPETELKEEKLPMENESSNQSVQNDDFMYDVNNNDPNNNTEYEVPSEVENQEPTKSHIDEPEDGDMEFQDQDDIRCKLLEEARLIHRIVPRQNLEQIYSYLEANLDRKNRLQIVMQEFLKMELSSECESDSGSSRAVSAVSERDSHMSLSSVKDSDEHKVIVPEPCTSSKSTLKSENVAASSMTEIQPCTSSTSDSGLEPQQVELRCNENSCDVDKIQELNIKNVDFQNVRKNVFNEVTSTSLGVEKSEHSSLHTGIVYNPQVGADVTNERSEVNCGPLEKNPETVDVPPIAFNDFDQPNYQDFKDELLAGEVKENLNPTSPPEFNYLIPKLLVGSSGKRKSNSPHEASPEKRNRIEVVDNIVLPELTNIQLKYKSQLLEMFPDADPEYLKRECLNIDSDLTLGDLITRMLQNPYPQRQVQNETAVDLQPQPGPSTELESREEKIESQYKILLAILPDADPSYLHEKCESLVDNENEMKAFVTDALENKKYPTKEEYLKRQEALKLQRKYKEQFSIEGFLEILPDPFKYFLEEKKNDASISNYALPYLKARYKNIRQSDILCTFKRNQYSLSKACDELDKFTGERRKTKRTEYECRIPTDVNIPFLQEVAFIENKKQIITYLKEKEEKKKKAFLEAKEKGELLQCGCCYDDEVMTEDIVTCSEGHLFCKECVKKFAEIKIGNGETAFPCLDDCGAEFSLKMLQAVLKPSVFSKMIQRKQLEEVKAAGIEDLESCPFCDFASIPPRDDKVFRCLNPDCMRESCRNCKEPNHIPLRCDEVEKADEVKVRTYIEDRMTEALVRTCWKCSKKFIKEDGCNKMTCTCGAMMCYICRQPVKDYKHFNGQGGDAYDKCPLYTNNDVVHVNPVIEEAEKAKEEMIAKNPHLNLKHDPTKNLPEAVQAQPGFANNGPFVMNLNNNNIQNQVFRHAGVFVQFIGGRHGQQEVRFHHNYVNPQLPQNVQIRPAHGFPNQPQIIIGDAQPALNDNLQHRPHAHHAHHHRHHVHHFVQHLPPNLVNAHDHAQREQNHAADRDVVIRLNELRTRAQMERERALKEAERARREAQKERERALKEAERARREAQKEREKALKEAHKERERAQKEAHKERERAQKEARQIQRRFQVVQAPLLHHVAHGPNNQGAVRPHPPNPPVAHFP